MKLSAQCFDCTLSAALEQVRLQLPETRQPEAVRACLKAALEIDWNDTPPELARQFFDVLLAAGGPPDAYAEAKRLSTELALQLLPEMRKLADAEPDRFGAIVKLVIGGNVIDCGINRHLVIGDAVAALRRVFAMELAEERIRAFEKRLRAAKRVFYVLDNCGEAVFDRLLLEECKGKVTLGVRGKYILNDVTREYVEPSGLGQYPVVDTGSSTPGVPMEMPPAFRAAFENCDLVIAKGQGNYETLEGRYRRPIAFLLRAKCPVVARSLQQEIGSLVLHLENC